MMKVIDRLSKEYREKLGEIEQLSGKLDEAEKVINDPTTLAVDYLRAQTQYERLKIEIQREQDFANGISWARELVFQLQANEPITVTSRGDVIRGKVGVTNNRR